MTESTELAIAYVALSDLAEFPRNPKLHALADLEESFARFGFVAPITVWKERSMIVAGHGRCEALVARRDTWRDPTTWRAAYREEHGRAPNKATDDEQRRVPRGIKVDGREWLVPCVFVSFKDEREARAFLMADNKIPELGGMDSGELGFNLAEIASSDGGLVGTGFSERDLYGIPQAVGPIVKMKANAPVSATLQLGDVVTLGEHVLVIGDCTDPEVIALLGPEQCDLWITDPPFGQNLETRSHKRSGKKAIIDNDGLAPDKLEEFLARAVAAAPVRGGAHVYMFHSDRMAGLRPATEHAFSTRCTLVNTLIWAKTQMGLGGGRMFRNKHEPILFGHVNGGEPRRIADRRANTVWTISSGPRPGTANYHPTMKPVALADRALRYSGCEDDRVFDGFAGVGFVLLACEQAGMMARCVELDPSYGDVLCSRWARLTERTPVVTRAGERFAWAPSEHVSEASTK